jgi:hypothetical protein
MCEPFSVIAQMTDAINAQKAATIIEHQVYKTKSASANNINPSGLYK